MAWSQETETEPQLDLGYALVMRVNRARSNPKSLPIVDTQHWEGKAYHAVCGFRAVTLQQPNSWGSSRGTDVYNMSIRDMRWNDPTADTIHLSPLGAKPAVTALPPPRTTTPQPIRYRRSPVNGRKITWEYSNPWDQGAWYQRAFGCPRTGVHIGVDSYPRPESVYTDADHLYLVHVGGMKNDVADRRQRSLPFCRFHDASSSRYRGK